MNKIEPIAKKSLYEADFFSWTEDQGRVLEDKIATRLDWENLAEEIYSLGRSQKREIKNRMKTLIMHLLKWEFQKERRSHSWQSTISEQRIHILGEIEDSPSLQRFPGDVYTEVWKRARQLAASETALPLSTFPNAPVYTVEELLDSDFMPGEPWKPEDLART